MDRYQPIDCGFHDQILEKATLRVPTQITYLDDEADIQTVKDVIEDVYTREGAEYMRLRSGLTIRLDKIRDLE